MSKNEQKGTVLEGQAGLAAFEREIMKGAELRVQTARRHYDAGREDCRRGVYDKWYRYHAAQDGRAYDLGWTAENKTVRNDCVKFLEP